MTQETEYIAKHPRKRQFPHVSSNGFSGHTSITVPKKSIHFKSNNAFIHLNADEFSNLTAQHDEYLGRWECEDISAGISIKISFLTKAIVKEIQTNPSALQLKMSSECTDCPFAIYA